MAMSGTSSLRRAVALVGAWFLGGCTTVPTAQAPNSDSWLELTTPHFRMRTNVYEPIARETSLYLEKTRAAMLGAAWRAKQGPPGRTDVVLFAHQNQLGPYVSSYSLGEMHSDLGFPRVMVFALEEHIGLPSVATHEMAHDLSAWYMPLQPTWLAEGLASFLQTVRIELNSNQAFIGFLPAGRFHGLARRTVDTAALTGRSEDARAPGKFENFYAQAWLLVHYFVFEQEERFVAFQQRLSNLEDWQTAYETAFGSALEPGPFLDKLLREHLEQRANWVACVVDVPFQPVEPSVRPLGEGEIHGLAARLFGRREPERARLEVAQALALEPTNLDALEVGFYLTPKSESETARRLAARALRSHPEAAVTWAMAVEAGLKPNDELTLRHALTLDPLNPRVLELLARAELHEHHAERAFIHASIALRRSGAFDRLAALYFASAQDSGHCAEARAIAHNSFIGEKSRAIFARELSETEPRCTPGRVTGAGTP